MKKTTDDQYTREQIIGGFPVPKTRMTPILKDLGALEMLVGTWNGNGNTMLATPAKEGLFRAIGHPKTTETITYTPGAPAPDRGGFEQPDIFLTGLRYHHVVSDTDTMEPLHEEMGFWLNVPATVKPKAPAGIIRELSIPHGNVAILFGDATVQVGPYHFPPLHAIPFPRDNFPHPDIYDSDNTGDVNAQLNDAQEGLVFHKSYVLHVKSRSPSDIVNIPFLVAQAASTSVDATFVVSVVTRGDSEPFAMLQYSQVIMLQFPALAGGPILNWPHTAVATLFKSA